MVGIADIEGAECVMGVSYTAAERSQMLGNWEGQIISALVRRKVRLANSMPMASRFDPQLRTFRAPAPQRALRFARAVPKATPHDDEDIAFATIGQLSAWLSSGALTGRRLMEIYLTCIEALGPKLECFAIVTRDRALAEADAADALLRAGVNLGPLHGIPYGLKDLFDTKGITTGWGAEPFRNRVPDSDATIVRKPRAGGAVLLGKITVGALANNEIWYGGWTRNPWNLNEGSSGSSAGSASATAIGLCDFAIGTERLGSITSPCQACGTTGPCPTFGRISRAGGMALCWSLDEVGPICRSVEDTAMVLEHFPQGAVPLCCRPFRARAAPISGDPRAGQSLRRSRRVDRAVHDWANARRQQLHQPSMPASAAGFPRAPHARNGLTCGGQADHRLAPGFRPELQRSPRHIALGPAIRGGRDLEPWLGSGAGIGGRRSAPQALLLERGRKRQTLRLFRKARRDADRRKSPTGDRMRKTRRSQSP